MYIIDIQHSCSVTLVSISVPNTIEMMRKKCNNEDGEDTNFPIECSSLPPVSHVGYRINP
jgi:hypothetical protein